MKIYKWLTSEGYYDSFSDIRECSGIKWYQAIERKDNLEPTIIKYVCLECGYDVVGIMLIDYTQPIIDKNTYPDLNDQMTHKLDFFPESFMLLQTIVTDKDIELFESEFEDAFRDIAYIDRDIKFSGMSDTEIYNMFKDDGVIINKPILNLT